MATQADIQQIYQQELGRTPDAAGLQYYTNLANQGTSLQEIARQISGSPEGTTFDPTGNIQYNPAGSTQFDMASYLQKATDPYTQAARASAQSNLQNAQQAVAANRVNQATPYGSLTYTQTTDASGNPVWTATQSLAPEFQQAFGNIAGQVAQGTAQGFNPTLPSTGINPGETYEAAIMRRLQPLQERESKALDTQLANQGIMPGSEAYNNAKTQLAQAQNDQRTSAVVGGFNTGLAANQQAYGQALTNYQLPLATMNQFRTATAPSYVNPAAQATVAGPDYLGAYTAQSNYNLGLQNAQNASNANLTQGLFNLGTAAILNPSAVKTAYNTITNPSSWFGG